LTNRSLGFEAFLPDSVKFEVWSLWIYFPGVGVQSMSLFVTSLCRSSVRPGLFPQFPGTFKLNEITFRLAITKATLIT